MSKVSERIRLIDEYVGQVGEVIVDDHERIANLEDSVGDISDALDAINGEVI